MVATYTGSTSKSCCKGRLRLVIVLSLLCLGLPACAGNSPGLSLGLGTGGVGLGLHSGNGYYDGYPYGGAYAGRGYSGVHVGIPVNPGYSRSGIGNGRIVGYQPARAPVTEEDSTAPESL